MANKMKWNFLNQPNSFWLQLYTKSDTKLGFLNKIYIITWMQYQRDDYIESAIPHSTQTKFEGRAAVGLSAVCTASVSTDQGRMQ